MKFQIWTFGVNYHLPRFSTWLSNRCRNYLFFSHIQATVNLFSTPQPSTAPHRHFQFTLDMLVLVTCLPRILRISYSEVLTGPLRDLSPPGMSDVTYITAQVGKLSTSRAPHCAKISTPHLSAAQKSLLTHNTLHHQKGLSLSASDMEIWSVLIICH